MLLALAAGCYRIDASVAGLSVSAGEQSFDGAGALAGQLADISWTMHLSSATARARDLSSARVESVTLAPVAGGSLDFLRGATFALHQGATQLVDVATMPRDSGGRIVLNAGVDVDPALLGAPLAIDGSLSLVAPADAWAMTVTASLSLRGGADVKP